MFKKYIIAALLCIAFATGQAQDKYFTKTGKIEFFSVASKEDINAKNKTVAAILDTKSGAIQFSVLLKGFEFKKALMQEHFNADYVESDKFPQADFKGTITNNAAIAYTKKGTYTAQIKGMLTLHGVTKNIETTGTIKTDGSTIIAASAFTILLSDYNIKIPAVAKERLSNSIKITVDCNLEPLKG